MIHRIRVEVLEETDVLRRITLLHTALLRVLTGTRLVRLIEADYNTGAIELLIEGADIEPNPALGKVHVAFLPTGRLLKPRT